MDMETMALRPKRRFTVEDYYRMGEAGILGEDDRVELIEGEIVEMPPMGSAHAGAGDVLATRLIRSIGDRAIVRVQHPVRLSELSEPVPDLCLIDVHRSPSGEGYREHLEVRPGERLVSTALTDVELDASGVLGA